MTSLTRLNSPSIPNKRRRRFAGPLGALAMTAALVAGLAACSGSDSSSDASDSGTSSESVPEEAMDGDSLAYSEAAGDTSSSKSSAGSSEGAPAARTPAIERSVISTGTVSLVSDDVATARRDVQRIVDGQQGTVSEEQTDTDDEGEAAYSRLVIRVPSKSFTATMQALEKAAELRQSQVTSEDVTTQVIDTDVRVRAQESSLRRVEQLLARANSLKDIIWIESQLTRRQGELDSLKSQQAWLSDQTSESTITIDIERKHTEKKEKEKSDDAGFLAGLKDGMKALGGFATAMATITGALLPFAIVLAIFGLPAWLVVRRSARRRTPKQPATS